MAAMTTTAYKGFIDTPEGHRLIIVRGRAQFLGKAKNRTITAGFNRLLGATVTPGAVVSIGTKTTLVTGYTPFVSTTQFTQYMQSRQFVVSRGLSGVISALVFNYDFVGY